MTPHSAQFSRPPKIAPVASGVARPRWSVMIPVRNRLDYLQQCLRSVLDQAPSADEMQIEVVDNSTAEVGAADFVRKLAGERVGYFRQPRDLGMAENWNSCIERALGELVHILHDDDWLASGFYLQLGKLAEVHPQAALLLSRCFIVDDDGIIESVTPRLRWLEQFSQDFTPNFGANMIYTPGIVVRRSFYERHGGFSTDWPNTTDLELTTRAIRVGGAAALSNPFCYYRYGRNNQTAVLQQSGENVLEMWRLGQHIAAETATDRLDVMRRVCTLGALAQYRAFRSTGEAAAAAANLRVWRHLSTRSERARVIARALAIGDWSEVVGCLRAATARVDR